jgi:ribosome biogenesis GTPase
VSEMARQKRRFVAMMVGSTRFPASDRTHARIGLIASRTKVPELSFQNEDPSATQSSTPSLAALGWSDRWQPHVADYEAGSPGRVIRHDRSAVLVGTEQGVEQYVLRPSTPALAVGDWVVVDSDRVVGLLPRASLLQRRDPSTGGSQPIAANIDIVGIVCGLDRPITPGRIQRFTSLAWDAGASPLVILSKADLMDSTAEVENDLLRQDPAADIISVSSETTDGISDLLDRCENRTLVLVGESGAGKSTLLNALAGRELGATGKVRSGDGKGRHTTTARQLFVLQGNCCLIDTPGVREVGIHTDVETIDDGFGDIAELAVECRFHDCGHSNEPGCEVQAAIADGHLDEDRMQAWEQLRREAAFSEIRKDPAARHKADRKLGRLIRDAHSAKRR